MNMEKKYFLIGRIDYKVLTKADAKECLHYIGRDGSPIRYWVAFCTKEVLKEIGVRDCCEIICEKADLTKASLLRPKTYGEETFSG